MAGNQVQEEFPGPKETTAHVKKEGFGLVELH